MGGALGFTWTDYLLALPVILLALFALGILLIDFMLPPEMKWANAVTAFVGVMFFRRRRGQNPALDERQ